MDNMFHILTSPQPLKHYSHQHTVRDRYFQHPIKCMPLGIESVVANYETQL